MNDETQVEQNETFIVQNITLGYTFVSDIGMQFGPREVKDLTWEDPSLIKRSQDLKSALRKGILKRLTQEEYDKTMELQYMREKKLLIQESQDAPKLKQKKVGDKTMLADTFDVTKASKKTAKLDFTGNANDTHSYATAYEIAHSLASQKGDNLTPEEFGDLVTDDPALVNKLLNYVKQGSSDVNHRAYFATIGDAGGESIVETDLMSNYNRDKRYAGLQDIDIAPHHARPEDLDLDADDDDLDENEEGEDYSEEISLEDEELTSSHG